MQQSLNFLGSCRKMAGRNYRMQDWPNRFANNAQPRSPPLITLVRFQSTTSTCFLWAVVWPSLASESSIASLPATLIAATTQDLIVIPGESRLSPVLPICRAQRPCCSAVRKWGRHFLATPQARAVVIAKARWRFALHRALREFG